MSESLKPAIASGDVYKLDNHYEPIPYKVIEGNLGYDLGLWRTSFTKLKRVGGDMILSNVDFHIDESIGRERDRGIRNDNYSGPYLESLGSLEYVGGDVKLHGANHLTDTGNLSEVGGNLNLSYVGSLESMPNLERVDGSLLLPNKAFIFPKNEIRSVDAPNLSFIGGDLIVSASESEMEFLEKELSREELIEMQRSGSALFKHDDMAKADATRKFNPEVYVGGSILVDFEGQIENLDWYPDYI